MATIWLQSKIHKLTVYKKPAVEKATLSFSVFSFFQHFPWKINDTLSEIVELYNKSKCEGCFIICLNKWQFLYKICCISHGNVGIIKILVMTKKLFQRSVFCNWLVNVTLICNHKAAISTCFRNCKSLISHIPTSYVYLADKKKFFLEISGIVQRGFLVII